MSLLAHGTHPFLSGCIVLYKLSLIHIFAGLSHINREKIDAIREAVKELEKAGYIVRSRERDEKGAEHCF